MEGYIKLHRKLLNNRIFKNEKLLKVFIWCLLKASHKEHEQTIGRQVIKLMPGQFIYGRTQAAAELKIKPSTLNDCISDMKTNSVIDIKTNNKYSLITLVNWDFYQTNNSKSNNKTDNKTDSISDTNKNGNKNGKQEISLQIENLRQRYDPETLLTIDNYLDILRTTRRSGKIADSVIVQVYKEMEKYPSIVVKAACLIVIKTPEHHSKKENYLYGIMRNTQADEAAGRVRKYESNQTGQPAARRQIDEGVYRFD